MSKFSKKLVSLTLTATTGVWMSGIMLLVPVAQAQSVADLQAQIAALLAQIQQLQAQLATQQGGAAAYTFTRNLTVGSTGADVKALQQFLNSHGAQVAASGTGSPGKESTYFGQLTKAALAKWQAANGVSPAVGYFGPITRAKVNSLGGGVVTPPGGGAVVPAPASGMTVSLAPENPPAGSLISSASTAAARVPVLAVRLTAGTASGITVSDLKFHKTGVVSDSSISGAYLVESGKVVAQYNSISGGVVTFSGLGLSVAAGQSRTLTLAIDPAAGLSAGNTVGFALSAATDVSATDATNAAVTVTGAFPLNGNTFTVTSVSNPSIASLSVASSSIGTTVTAGTQNNLVGAWSFTGSNSKIWLKSINFRVIGSANKTDLKNVKLLINGTQVGSTLASVSSDGSAYFDASANPGVLNTGSNNVQVYADVMGSPSFNFQFEILNSYDIYAVDSQYNVPVTAGSNVGTQVTINQGQVTVNVASDTPTGNVAKGQAGVTLAKFTVYAAGEPVKIKWLTFTLTFSGGTGATLDSYIKNVHMDDDAGGQLGSTISSLATTVTCKDQDMSAATTTATNCFGNSTSPINYIIPANTTRVLSLKGDIQSAANFNTITAALVQGTNNNLQGTISSQGSNSSAASGSSLSLASSALTVAKNTAVGTQTFSKGATNRKIGSYALTASSAEGVTINNVSILMSASSTNFSNLKVMVGSQQIGSTQGVLSASATYSFAGNFTVPAGQTTYVDVYADVLSGTSAATYTTLTTLSGCSGSGAVSYTAVSCTSTPGQDVTIAGQATLRVSANSSLSPAAGQVVMGSTGNSLAAFQLTETTNIEDIKITDLYVFDQVAATSSVKAAFNNLKLYKSTDLSTALANSGSATAIASGTAYYYAFHFASPVVVPQANSVSLVLKGDVSSYSSQGATDNTTHVFKIATTTDTAFDTPQEVAVALGNTSNATSAVTLSSASGNTLTVLRSKVTVTAAGLGATTGRAKAATDDLGTITFAADSAGAVAINTITITFSGSAPSSTAFLPTVDLIDASGNSVMLTSGVASTTGSACTGGTSTCTKTWNLGSTTSGWNVSAGSSYTFKLRANTLNTQSAVANVTQNLAATVNAATDVLYTDALDASSTTNISLPSNAVPITVNSVSFVQGQ